MESAYCRATTVSSLNLREYLKFQKSPIFGESLPFPPVTPPPSSEHRSKPITWWRSTPRLFPYFSDAQTRSGGEVPQRVVRQTCRVLWYKVIRSWTGRLGRVRARSGMAPPYAAPACCGKSASLRQWSVPRRCRTVLCGNGLAAKPTVSAMAEMPVSDFPAHHLLAVCARVVREQNFSICDLFHLPLKPQPREGGEGVNTGVGGLRSQLWTTHWSRWPSGDLTILAQLGHLDQATDSTATLTRVAIMGCPGTFPGLGFE